MKRTVWPLLLLLATALFPPARAAAPRQRGGGRKGRNKAFRIQWNGMGALPKAPAPQAGKKAGERKSFLLPKPVLVYLTSSDPKCRKNQDYLEHLVFRDARVALGSHFFLCLRGRAAETPRDPFWAPLLEGKRFPRIVVVSRDRRVVVRLQGRIKSGRVLAAMQKVASWDYKTPFHHYITELRKTIIQLGALEKSAAWMEKVQHSGRKFKRPQLEYLRKYQKKVLALIAKLEKKKKKLQDLELKKTRK